ncbi:MAG: amidase domain-containing protein [Bacteroidales bacterium]|nr:amidase domain-containing protein [Lachnoclostridium sp.]MCM1384938.1 amidase domain-containing protein [Lachnoclostridium sp.]MCM1465826.1 amidase domain-containing protein [Bacteroidales bacterium]
MIKRKTGTKMPNRFMMFCLIFALTIGNMGIAKAQEKQCAVEEMVLQEYKNALLSRNAESFNLPFEDPEKENLFMRFLEWRTAMMDVLNVAYSTYEYEITDVAVETEGEWQALTVSFNETHQYSNGAGNGASYGLIMHIDAKTSSDGVKLMDISFENDDFYNYFMEQMIMPATESMGDADTVREQTDRLIVDLYELKAEMDSVYLKQRDSQREPADDEEIAPYATSCIYSGSMGASYANKYAKSRNTYFYDAGADCTNFVSQCIWAAYGGWSTSMSDTAMKNNITNKVRMTSTWYAGSGGGSPAWENVDRLWDYAVGNSGNGPKARGYNDGGYYTGILPIDIAVGDVLQKSEDGSDYFHSMYVISTPGGSDPKYNEIMIAQHSSTPSVQALSEVFLIRGKYFRQMHFITNNFDK